MQQLLASIVSLLVAFSHAQSPAVYSQSNFYENNGKCAGQPTVISSSLYGQCQIPTLNGQSNVGTSSCTEYSGIYQSIKTSCNTAPLNLTGIVQLYVAKYSWTSSDKCAGNPEQVEMVVGDANCHPYSTGSGGAITQWRLVNCNGGRPIYQVCQDAGCSKCDTVTYTSDCQSTSAASSLQLLCVYPDKANSPNGNKFLDDSAASGVSANVVVAGAVSLIALALIN
ncbi:hypothetical protein MIR68_011655 [Amoeboaphelidium protococcarum]|nr:hypothetical protein MIR68_011655 [Amoeboaphelidium protococcarum]